MKDYEKWIKKAESDFLNLKNNFAGEEVSYDTACFHSQQAVEKYLKAYLNSKNIKFAKTHDLKVLIEQCIERNKVFVEIEKITARLTEFGIAPRYPGFLEDITASDAQQAYQNAIIIKDFILKNFFD